jgi:cytochrome c oxidase subunit 2
MKLRLFPEAASTIAGQVDWVMFALLALCMAVLAGVVIVMIYYIVRYRAASEREGHVAPQQKGYNVELTWTLLPLVLFVCIFIWGAKIYYHMHEIPAGASDVYVVGKQWMWKFEHPNGVRELDELHVPVGQPIRLVMTSQDVIHSFFVPAFRIKQDVIPGRYVYEWFQATRPGKYHLFCTQYCGLDHARMRGRIVALSKQDYERWLASGGNRGRLTPASGPGFGGSGYSGRGGIVSRGHALYRSLGCVACHGENSPQRAPQLTGIFETEVLLRNGQKVIADENYLHESIVDPAAKMVSGYEPIMPSFSHVPEEDLMALVAYLKAGAPGSGKGP